MFFHSIVFTQQAEDAWLTPECEQDRVLAGGTYLIRGVVTGHDYAHSAVLTLCLVNGKNVDVDVLVTRNGQIQEMVKASAGVRAMKLNFASSANELTNVRVSLRRLSWLEYRFRQVRRVLPVFFQQTHQRRARAGLRLHTLVTNLTYAYSVACRFRANAYMRSYSDWYAEFYSVSPEDRQLMRKHLRNWHRPPHFEIVILGAREGEEHLAVEASLQQQVYPHFSVVHIPDDGWEQKLVELSVRSLKGASFGVTTNALDSESWTLVLRNGTRLSDAALYWLAYLIDDSSRPSVVYADHDVMTADGRLSSPAFKPDWSPELLRATNYIGDAFAWRTRSLKGIWDASEAATYSTEGALHSLLLAVTEDAQAVGHVTAPLWHLNRDYFSIDSTCGRETSQIVNAHLRKKNINATVSADGQWQCHVRYLLPSPPPLVTIIIPTRDGLTHLRCCIDSLLEKTAYNTYEVIVVDNQSVQPETLAYLDHVATDPRVRVCSFDEPFNYSRINNYAVRQAKGTLLCLLNNDTEIISPDWLTEMVGLALQPDVGAVGAKLLYGNDTVQHGGDTVGPGGCANHLHSGIGRDDPGYCGRAVVTQDLSAVTAACMLTHKSLYESLGGLNETHLKIAFNDVDMCLRIREAGQRVIWTPHALLYHHESVSRGKDTSPAQMHRARSEVEYMRTRWAHLMHHDPFYNPNLNYQRPDFSLSGMPHVMLPWEAQ